MELLSSASICRPYSYASRHTWSFSIWTTYHGFSEPSIEIGVPLPSRRWRVRHLRLGKKEGSALDHSSRQRSTTSPQSGGSSFTCFDLFGDTSRALSSGFGPFERSQTLTIMPPLRKTLISGLSPLDEGITIDEGGTIDEGSTNGEGMLNDFRFIML